MLKSFVVFFAAAAATLCAGVEDHLKIPTDKSGYHSMMNVDYIYTLNLDQRPEKFEKCTKQLNPFGIYPYRFSAVNGWELTLADINDVGVKYQPWMETGKMGTCYLPDGDGSPHHEIVHVVDRNYFCHCMARGTIGIVLSHMSILQDAYDSGYETIWVMEDDIQVIRNPHLISYYIEKLDKLVGKDNWDILFTDRDTKDKNGNYVPCLSYAWRPNFTPDNSERFAKRKDIGKDFTRVGARYGAYSMIVRRSGMEKIMKFIKEHQIFLPYDMDFYLPNDIRMYSLQDDVVSTLPDALSDNGSPNYTKSLEKDTALQSMKELTGWCSEEKAIILMDLIQMTKPETIVEIGVWGGKSLIPMAYAVKGNGFGKVYGIDPWSTVASAQGMDGANLDWWSAVDHEFVYQSLVNAILKFDLCNQIVLIRETSENVTPMSHIGLLHIDGNHSEEASYLDVTKWVPYVKKGGLVVFDDVNWGTTGRAVRWLDENCIKLFEIHGDNIWGVWIKP